MSLWNTVNQLADKLPEGYITKLGIEQGSAWVELYDDFGNEVKLPDSTDKNLQQQLTDALTEAKEIVRWRQNSQKKTEKSS